MILLDRLLFRGYLSDEEKLIFAVHQHWFALYRPVAKIGFFGLVLPILFWLMLPPAFYIFAVWFVVAFMRFLYEVIDWYFDVLLVTSDGIIDIDWRGVFSKSSHRIEYESITGVHYEKEGLWGTLFDFGPLHITIEGHESHGHVGLEIAASPLTAEHRILHAKEKYEHHHAMEGEHAIRDILAEMIDERIRLKNGGGHDEHGGHGLADML